MCGGCRLTVGGKTKFACVDGPDFDGFEVDFDEAMHLSLIHISPLPDCQSDPVEPVIVNTLGLVNVLENARRTGVKHVIQASTNAMYENETEFPTVASKFNPPTLISVSYTHLSG